MKFLCLGYYRPDMFDTMSEAEQAAVADRCRPHDAALHASGRLRVAALLERRTAVTLRPNGGRTSVTDGPFIEAKELVGAFFIIEAEDLEEAVRIASLHPAAKLGEDLGFDVEVRPIEMYAEVPQEAAR